MAFALAGGIAKTYPEVTFTAFDISESRLDLFSNEIPRFTRAQSNEEAAEQSDILFLAVKPQVIEKVLPEISGFSKCAVSIMAGIPLIRLKQFLPAAQLVRVMPNTPCLVGAMAAGCSFEKDVPEEVRQQVHRLLSTSGIVEDVPENLMDAVTALSGSGPAFMARLFDYFIQAAQETGLPAETARRLCLQTAAGTALLLKKQNMKPDELIGMVSSPGGTTVAGRAVLEESETADTIRKTVFAAFERGRELGRGDQS